MDENYLLTGRIKWSFNYELANVTSADKALRSIMSFSPPLHHHTGYIKLTESDLIIEGTEDDEELSIKLASITQIYMGFDDVYPVSAVKSFGAFWNPIRIEYYRNTTTTDIIYAIIDYNGLYTQNQVWFNKLLELLS